MQLIEAQYSILDCIYMLMQGMKPYVFSRVKLKEAGVFWVPGGVNLSLEKRELRY